MGLGIAKIDQKTITEQLGDMSIVALDDFGTDPLICTDHIPVLFGVELAGELGGVDEVTEHHGQLPSFRVRRRRGSSARCDLRGVAVPGQQAVVLAEQVER